MHLAFLRGTDLMAYRRVLMVRDFRRLWVGATISMLGDGMTFLALSWLVLSGPEGAQRLGLLGVSYTLPVLLGGLAVGKLLDRFDKRVVFVADSLLRAIVVATVPVTAALGVLPGWLPFLVAGVHGALKMVPLAGIPTAIPQLVPEADLDAANALESFSFSLASIAGPAIAGILVGVVGPANVLTLDVVTFLAFALSAGLVGRPLAAEPRSTRPGRMLSLSRVLRDPVITWTTVAFMAFNVAAGMLLVLAPWLARHRLPGGAATLGVLLTLLAVGEVVGAAYAGQRSPRSPLRTIAVVQIVAGLTFLALLTSPNRFWVGGGFFLLGLLSAPMTVYAQSLRMRRIPAALHGRAFAGLRTMMQLTLPVGTALATPFMVGGHLDSAAITMTLVAVLPAVGLLALRESAPPTYDDQS